MSQEPKKSWALPELVVIVRGTPQESVLSGCKSLSPPSGANGSTNACAGSGGDCLANEAS